MDTPLARLPFLVLGAAMCQNLLILVARGVVIVFNDTGSLKFDYGMCREGCRYVIQPARLDERHNVACCDPRSNLHPAPAST